MINTQNKNGSLDREVTSLPIFNEMIARERIPKILRESARWFVYRVSWDINPSGKAHLKKIPYSIRQKYPGVNFNWDEKRGWSTFNEMCAYIKAIDDAYLEYPELTVRFRLWPGFPIIREYQLMFVDLDGCILDDGTLTETAQEMLDFFNQWHTYQERSISGKGLHIFSWCSWKGECPTRPRDGVEIYRDGRGALITGAKHE